ncbi:hypothetical protein BCR32DRAFT_329139 [Anaeromyces robustus]|uniref:Glycosyl transferase family 1 domain-containing protein n=1 Tax=Anaeromyces robustus TaxID=1754192 RepID=A0A1Y1WTV9_9FUNG|nr:hypothetical protein BCR32DRAFT_329139 [Anaeromyces robustus]|eukprot:ORX76892.1 hypothetical protein BCR32DRAFT_329139 [Anaeromyces robustus]
MGIQRKRYTFLIVSFVITVCLIINIKLFKGISIADINNYQYGSKNVNNLKTFLNCRVKENTVIIFEPNTHHQECIPGFAKYFIDLGFNVDILLNKGYEDALFSFYPDEKLRVFTFDNLPQIRENPRPYKEKFEKYEYIFINSGDPDKKDLFENLGALYSKNGLIVGHDIGWVGRMGQFLYDEGRIITIGNFSKGIQVVPQYFGEREMRTKNSKTRFFITSTWDRDYEYFLDAVRELKEEGLDFEVIVVGYTNTLNEEKVAEDLKSIFNFKYKLSFNKMFEEIENTDYIIITLDPRNKDAETFKTSRATGSTQIAHGFYKPPIIHEDFAPKYYLTGDNSLIYKESNFTDVLRQAIKMTTEEYKEKQINLKSLSEYIYSFSIENLKSVLNHKFENSTIPINNEV